MVPKTRCSHATGGQTSAGHLTVNRTPRCDHDQDRYLMTVIAPTSIVDAVCSNCWSTAGNDGARQNRTAKVPSQHNCPVIELRAASVWLLFWRPPPAFTAGANIFAPMLQQRCQPIPKHPLIRRVPYSPRFRSLAAFGRRPWCSLTGPRGPASETHHRSGHRRPFRAHKKP
jgi:hypothetical protein